MDILILSINKVLFSWVSGGLSTIAIVRVQITDVNDNSPIFEPQKYNVTLRSDAPFQGPILRVVASDLDAGLFGQVAYRITSGNEAGIFRIDRNTGELHVSRPSLLSRSALHQLNITATDAAGLKSTVDAEVRITMSLPGHRIATCERPRYVLSVKENQPQSTVVGGIKDTVSTSSLSEDCDEDDEEEEEEEEKEKEEEDARTPTWRFGIPTSTCKARYTIVGKRACAREYSPLLPLLRSLTVERGNEGRGKRLV
ncbi:protein dachsous isoform X3 [Vespula maculifrons]|uniref:Protein dachsous isoform X3 n=1 Tax=Vespula maculifrons TaxID=7453 RepID=A0ABD2BII2_VESMC